MSDAPNRTELPFAELVAATHFSFLRGASHPGDMVARGIELGLAGLGIADRNTVSGVVRAYAALDLANEKAVEAGIAPSALKLVFGARLVFIDGTPDIVAYAATRQGWGRLTRLLTRGNLRAIKGDCILRFDDLLGYLDDLLLIVLPASTATPQTPHPDPPAYDFGIEETASVSHLKLVPPAPPRDLAETLTRLAKATPGNVWLGVACARHGDDDRRLAMLAGIAGKAGVPLLATTDALYATAADRPLHDVLTCVREGTTLAAAGRRLEANGERHIKAPAEIARLFRRYPQATTESARLLGRVDFHVKQLGLEYPHEPVPKGWEPQAWMEHLVLNAVPERYPAGLTQAHIAALKEECALVKSKGYAYYFLTVHDIVHYARSLGILCQGRGSAANSVLCYLLGITAVDPIANKLLFTRFISEDRDEPPDIDVDFEHERREEVMQYIYRRYGRHRAAIAATVIHYRSRSAAREVAKALGLSEDISNQLSGTIWGSYGEASEKRFAEAGLDTATPEMARLHALMERLLDANFPRHLSQHVGGYVLTQHRIDDTVPLHNAAMKDRTFIEWDKDDIDKLRIMKVDILALGMLTCIRKCLDLMRENGLGDYELHTIPKEDPEVYEMLCTGDSIGVFQVESRAQINMLPRLKPKELYDLVIQVAIVRPGPIEGDMVHPYLRRRCGEEKAEFPSPDPPHPADELHQLLGKTFGVPLFQEQAMKLAIVAAEFPPQRANQLRRAMATFRNVGTIHTFEEEMVGGMTSRGYERDFAERCYKQIQGFGSYGFPESHAQSFAILVYISSWLKCHHPAVFTCALLNSQPMGFYAPAQLVKDAQDHGVMVRPIDVTASVWDNTLEPLPDGRLALRLGLRQITGFREFWAGTLAVARAEAPFTSIEDMARRAQLPSRALSLLADADACTSLADSRRDALWDVRRTPSAALPLFAAMDAGELGEESDDALPAMPLSEEVAIDYQTARLSLKGHPMQFLRPVFAAERVLSAAQANAAPNGRRASVAGVVLIRQRPGNGNAIFITIEDETGIVNALLWARLFETQRRAVMGSRLVVIEGEIQKSREGVVHLMASRVHDRTHELSRLSETPGAVLSPGRIDPGVPERPRGSHPRDVRILPRSRDFH